MRIGVLGGTFDPVHWGHLVLAEQARDQLSLERVLFVPAGLPWRKVDRAVSPVAQRVEMVRLALESSPFELSLLEAERPGPSYTVDTLQQLREMLPGAELYFIMGHDALWDLPNWHRPADIVSLACLAVARRPDRSGEEALAEVARRLPAVRERVVWLEMPLLGISGSDIRRRVREGRSIRYLVPPAVEDYIHRHGLYR
ncbi:MAG TPA: nicotinate-nucleotide adenylyltransferase [Dehalococcoidia bacterium]|nr:nicotinate-nucleotide adenylyltransferase [Dehalococcoidia bacterium]